MEYKIIEATPQQWLAEYRKNFDVKNINLDKDKDGYHFVLNQPWAILKEELDNGAIEPKGTYYKIDDSGRLYEAPWED